MEFYIKRNNQLRPLGSTPPLEDFETISNKVTELENKVNQMQDILNQQG